MSMPTCRTVRTSMHRRPAMVVVQVVVLLSVLLGFAAFTIDLGRVQNARNELQRTADSAALAGASAYTSDDMMRIRLGTGDLSTFEAVQSLADSRVTFFAGLNPTYGTTTSIVATGDIKTGWINLNSATEPINQNPAPTDYNAVSVQVRRDASEGGNGAIPYFFAPLMGYTAGETGAVAVAAFDDRFAGFSADDPGVGIVPFSVHRDAFMADLLDGGDQYRYDENVDVVEKASDGIREIRLYPYPLSGSGYTEGDGNFGMLNIGTGNQGADAEADQITNGVTAEDLAGEIGTSEPMFFDSDGNAITYTITGSPGLTASLKAAVRPLIGDVIGFFLHDNVVESGSNTIYTITGMRFGRVMDVRLTGPPHLRGLFVQPVSYAGSGVRVSPEAPSSGGLVGRIVLVR